MENEKLKILEMIQDGKISAGEGMELLKAIDDTAEKNPSNTSGRFLRIRVNGDKAKKVNVNIPLKLVKVFSKFAGFGMKFIPEEARAEMEKKGINLSEMDIGELIQMIEQGLVDEKLVDVDVDDPTEGRIRVEVYVD